jgi:hypothetical protein
MNESTRLFRQYHANGRNSHAQTTSARGKDQLDTSDSSDFRTISGSPTPTILLGMFEVVWSFKRLKRTAAVRLR